MKFATNIHRKQFSVIQCWETQTTSRARTKDLHPTLFTNSNQPMSLSLRTFTNNHCINVETYLDPELLNAMEYAAVISSIASYALYVQRSCQSQRYAQVKSQMKSGKHFEKTLSVLKSRYEHVKRATHASKHE